jgi:hypothetical protein
MKNNMKICGFTIIRNALKYDFPVVESVKSILPICDSFLISVGNSDDGTFEYLSEIFNDPKVQIIRSVWDDSLREGGKVLAVETDKAMDAINGVYEWLFYIQADEIVHEKYLDVIKEAAFKYKDDKNVEALLFRYKHFWGTYQYFGDSRKWYRREIRMIRNNKNIRSYRDAQGFRKNNNKLNAKLIDAEIYHYGWVKHPETMALKKNDSSKFWHDDDWVAQNNVEEGFHDYNNIDSVSKFEETHPSVMAERINNYNFSINLNLNKKKLSLRNKLLHAIESLTGYRLFEYKNYKIIR